MMFAIAMTYTLNTEKEQYYCQVSIEEDLKDSREVSFQAALLYTSSKGERRIRVHTLCLPTTASLQEVVQGADQVSQGSGGGKKS